MGFHRVFRRHGKSVQRTRGLPAPSFGIQAHDRLLVLGDKSALAALERVLRERSA